MIFCPGRLVSKTDNATHFARLVKQASADLSARTISGVGSPAVCWFKFTESLREV